jgi:hypothetical protein
MPAAGQPAGTPPRPPASAGTTAARPAPAVQRPAAARSKPPAPEEHSSSGQVLWQRVGGLPLAGWLVLAIALLAALAAVVVRSFSG